MRQTRGSIICPKCDRLISVDEERCPFCGAWRPGLYGFAPALKNLFGGRMDFITFIITACVVLYGVALAIQPSAIFEMRGFLNLLSPGMRALYQLGMTGGFAWEQHWWWTLLTAIYLHGGLLHIFFNVMWIRSLAPAVDELYGPARGFVLFSVSGAAGFLLSNLVSHAPSIGASGSIFGLLAALIVYHRRAGLSLGAARLWQWAIIMFVMGFVMSGVNVWAHAGGFAGGWLAAICMRPSGERREGAAVQLLALALLAVTLVGFVLSFVMVTKLVITG